MRISLRLPGVLIWILAMGAGAVPSPGAVATMASADAGDITPTTAPGPDSKLNKTVGIDVVEMTANPDKSLKLTFQWKEADGKLLRRSVVVNDGTVIGIDGKLTTLADVNAATIRKKAVATVGPDGVTAVMLRFGRALLAVGQDQLTPAQVAALKAAAPPATPQSDASIDRRAADIAGSLHLDDPAREARVKAVLVDDLKAVRDAHNAGFAPAASVRERLNAGLAADLTGEQVEAVKDRLTVNKVPVTYKAYQEIVPDLTDADKATILDLLKQAREQCLDVKNPDEMAAVFKPYKTRINQYLDAHGHNWEASYKAFVDKQQQNPKGAQTRPAGDEAE